MLVALVAIPLALLARWESRTALTVTCTTAAMTPRACTEERLQKGVAKRCQEETRPHRCFAHDASTGEVRAMPCDEAQRVLEDLLGSDGPTGFATRPFVNAQSFVGPLERKPVPSQFVSIGSMGTAAFPHLPDRSASDEATARAWPKVERDRDGSVTRASARSLLAACAAAPPAERDVRTVALAMFPRDARGSVAAFLGALVALAWVLARRTRVDVDPDGQEVRITEHIGPFAKRGLVLPASAVVDVVLSTGASGPLLGRRVELVLGDGSRVPLLGAFVALAGGAHERAIRRLRAALAVR